MSTLVKALTVVLSTSVEDMRESARIAVYRLYLRSMISSAVPLAKVAST